MIERHRETESPVGRRELLASMGLGAAAILGLGITQEVEGARAQVEEVADKGSTLRITSVRGFSVVGTL